MVAQRQYGSSSTAADVSPAFGAGWTKTSLAERFKLLNARDNSTQTNATKLSQTTAGYCLSYQWVSDPIGAGSTTGSETFKAYMLCREGGANIDAYAAMRAVVVSNDGSTVRGVLFDLTNTGGTEFATSNTNRPFPVGAPVTLAAISWSDNDRVVVEGGASQRNAGTVTAQNIVLRNGAPTAGSDLGENETDTSGISWFEWSFTWPAVATSFSGGVTFTKPSMSSTETETENLSGGVTYAKPTLAATVTETMNYAAAIAFAAPSLAASLQESYLLTGGLSFGAPSLSGTFTQTTTTGGKLARGKVPRWYPVDDDEEALLVFIAAHRRPLG